MDSRDTSNDVVGPSQVDIVHDGDVVLLVGREDKEQKQKRIRVHSLVLRTASPYFAILLGPNFAEGQNLSSESPKDIPVHENDPTFLEIILNVIHFRTDAVPDPPDPALVLELAIATDKYDFIRALKLTFQSWLRCDRASDTKGWWRLAIASAWVKDDLAFKALTRELVYRYEGAFDDLGEVNKMPPNFASRFLARIEGLRAQFRLDWMCRLIKLAADTAKDACPECHHEKISAIDFITSIWDIMDPGRMELKSIKTVLDALLAMNKNNHAVIIDGTCREGPHEEPDFDTLVREEVDKFMETVCGLSLTSFLRSLRAQNK